MNIGNDRMNQRSNRCIAGIAKKKSLKISKISSILIILLIIIQQTNGFFFSTVNRERPLNLRVVNQNRCSHFPTFIRRRVFCLDKKLFSFSVDFAPAEVENSLNPTDASPLSGVSYLSVQTGLDCLYPPEDLQSRNALSRTDGYWNFVKDGIEPPQHLTYGEFDFHFFAQLLDRANYHHDHCNDSGWDNKVFADIGSGTGRLVLGAAALHPTLKLCRGLELLPGIHELAVDNLNRCKKKKETRTPNNLGGVSSSKGGLPTTTGISAMAQYTNSLSSTTTTTTTTSMDKISTDSYVLKYSIPSHVDLPSNFDRDGELPLAPISLECSSFEDPCIHLGDIDIGFVFSTCMVEKMSEGLSQAFGRGCKPGTIIITTDYPLSLEGTIEPTENDPSYGKYKLEIVEEIHGNCWLTGGTSTAFVHRVTQSLW